jgi:hypothetical protein
MTIAYTAGELQKAYYVTEGTYGEIPTDQLKWVGETLKLTNLMDKKKSFEVQPGSRSFGVVNRSPQEHGFVLTYHDRAGSEWTEFFATLGYGSSSGLTDRLGSFTFFGDEFDGTTHNWQIYSGSKVNRSSIIAAEPGKLLDFQIEAFAQYFQVWSHATSRTITGDIQNVIFGANPSAETGDELTWAGQAKINLDDSSLVDLEITDWKLDVLQKLTRDPGFKDGDDSIVRALATGLFEGDRGILFEANAISKDMVFANSKRKDELITALTIPIDDEVITLTGGEWVADDMPEYAQEINTEALKMQFNNLTIA